MLGRVFGSRAKTDEAAGGAAAEREAMMHAMSGVLHIMDDDTVTAEKILSESNDSYHLLGKGLSMFLQAVLGFEQDVMRSAASVLGESETVAYEKLKKAQRRPQDSATTIYPAGMEFSLSIAESQLMRAVLAVLNESLTESIKGFYNMRKAYMTLQTILQAERQHLAKLGLQSADANVKSSSRPSTRASGAVAPSSRASIDQVVNGTRDLHVEEPKKTEEEDDSDDDFADAEEEVDKTDDRVYKGKVEVANSNGHADPNEAARQPSITSLGALNRSITGPDVDVFSGNPVDAFIHAGSNLCFGVLSLLLSIIPPAFATLLRIVGFRGDRERGLAMLWQASKSVNDIHGPFAGLVLLGYYNGALSFCEILREDAIPRARCRALLKAMRTRFPKSRLWLLEEARMLAQDRQIKAAVKLLDDAEESPLRQVQALQLFESNIDNMCMHNYKKTSQGYQRCVELNNWSHGLYYYIAGVNEVEAYRHARLKGDTKAADEAKAEATRLLKLVPEHSAKKRLLGRQLPFDVFAMRKLRKWEERAKARGTEFIDAIGVSPVEEMIFFWNGGKRMRTEDFDQSLENLAWSEKHDPHWKEEGLDERAIHALLRASALRNLHRFEESKAVLRDEVLCHEWHHFKGGNKDNWTLPVANLEWVHLFTMRWGYG